MASRRVLPAFIPHFCPSLQKDLLFVRQLNGFYEKYRFNAETREFERFECPDCHLEATERDLRPLYTSWSRELGRYVIIVRNMLNGSVEQYVYDRKTARFLQVALPTDIRVETRRRQASATLFTVGGVGESAVILIMRDSRGFLKRKMFSLENQRFEDVPPEPVIPLRIGRSLRIPNRNYHDEELDACSQQREIEKETVDSTDLQRWLSQCLTTTDRKTAERERDAQFESLLRTREKEYRCNRFKYHGEPEFSENEKETLHIYENEKKYGELNRSPENSRERDSQSSTLCHSGSSEEKDSRKTGSEDVNSTREQSENAQDSETETIVIDEEIYEVFGSEVTV